MSSNHYQTLGVPTDADRKSIDRAYRKLVRALHPDVNPSPEAQERLPDINDAYAVLSHTRRREAYDERLGITRMEPEHPSAAYTRFAVVGDVNGQRGPDIVVEVTLTPADLVTGASLPLRVPFQQPCGPCQGTGYDPSAAVLSCATCSGLGMDAVTSAPCPHCRGRGVISRRLCAQCRGERSSAQSFSTTVTIPPGVRAGVELVQAAGGLPGLTRRGDLRVVVTVDLPAYFIQPPGGGVGLTVPFYSTELELGVTVTIPTVTGTAELTVDPHTAPGHIVVVEAGGLPDGPDHVGPLHVRCELAPNPQTDAVREALIHLMEAQRSAADVRSHLV